MTHQERLFIGMDSVDMSDAVLAHRMAHGAVYLATFNPHGRSRSLSVRRAHRPGGGVLARDENTTASHHFVREVRDGVAVVVVTERPPRLPIAEGGCTVNGIPVGRAGDATCVAGEGAGVLLLCVIFLACGVRTSRIEQTATSC